MNERKDLPPTTAVNFLERVKEELTVYMGNRGAPLDGAVRFRDLADGRLVNLSPAFLAGRGGQGQPSISGPGTAVVAPYVPDLTPPPSVTGFTALAAISNLLLSTDAPVFTVGHGYLQTVLYGVTRASGDPLPTFANAVEISRFVGAVTAYPTNPATIWHLWVKWKSVDGVLSESPAGGINGVSVTTAVDVTRLIAALTGPGNPFKVVTTSYTLADGTVVPVGTYTSDAYMGSFVAARGQIGLLAVDDARIASLQVNKLKAGSISVGEYIQSTGFLSGSNGWRINGNGVAEFAGVIVRGTVYATAGTIGGSAITADAISSVGYDGITGWSVNKDGTAYFGSVKLRGSLAGGAFTGFAYPPSGQTGFYLGPEGLLLGNANDNKYITIRANGNVEAPGMSIANGVLSISQVDVIDTLNVKGNAITVPSSTTGSSYGTALTVTLAGGQPAYISCLANGGGVRYDASIPRYAYLYINGSLVRTVTSTCAFFNTARYDVQIALIYNFTPPTTAAYTFLFSASGNEYDANVFVIQTKR